MKEQTPLFLSPEDILRMTAQIEDYKRQLNAKVFQSNRKLSRWVTQLELQIEQARADQRELRRQRDALWDLLEAFSPKSRDEIAAAIGIPPPTPPKGPRR
jgi:hypothetical protein